MERINLINAILAECDLILKQVNMNGVYETLCYTKLEDLQAIGSHLKEQAILNDLEILHPGIEAHLSSLNTSDKSKLAIAYLNKLVVENHKEDPRLLNYLADTEQSEASVAAMVDRRVTTDYNIGSNSYL